MAGETIKVNAEEVLGHVGSIAEKMAEVSVPGPVPPLAPATSPIDVALNTVVLAAVEKATQSSTALEKRGTEHNALSQRAVANLETQEESNAADLTAIQPQGAQSGNTGVWT